MKRFIISTILACSVGTAGGQTIDDPVRDFLALPIESRYTDASEVVKVYKVSIDLDLDGNPELLVGHPKMWWGDNHGIYFAIYGKLPDGGYKRLTKATEDVGLIFRDGDPKYNYVGRVDELNETGLLICTPYQGDPDFSKTRKIESTVFVSIAGDAAHVRELPGLDLGKEADLSFYQKYFPLPGKQGGYHSESLSPDDLKALGYVLPDWTKPVRLKTSGAVANQSASNTGSNHPADSRAPEKDIGANRTPPEPSPSSERPASSTLWSIITVLVIAAVGSLLWLLLKRSP